MTQPKPTPLNMYEGEEVEPYLCGAYNFPLDQLRLVLTQNYADREAELFDKLSRSQPIGRMGTPAEVAALALYLCSDEAGFVTGCDYPMDGGFITLNN